MRAIIDAVAGRASGRNYPDATGPRFARLAPGAGATRSLRVVTFNLEYGRRVAAAVQLFRASPPLRAADVIVMQEMNEDAVERVADALGMGYVYYPAVRNPRYDLNFGNAILARWPIAEDRKLVLPGLSRFGRTQRVAVSGTIRLGATPVRVYAVHLATVFDNGPAAQRAQVRAILADAARDEHVIVAGDMNCYGLAGREFARAGYLWATRGVGPTMRLWRVDHVFVRGLSLTGEDSVGVVRDTGGASDHRPVWAVVGVAEAAARRPEPMRPPGSRFWTRTPRGS